ncbi:MAG: type II secretion system F family protein [Nitrospinales bacterium]
MTLFQYNARNKRGQLVSGTMNAPDANAVGQELARMGHFPVKIHTESAVTEKKEKKSFLQKFQKVTSKDMVLFTRQMATLFNAGIPLLGILAALKDQIESPKFKDVIAQVQIDIEGGLSLSEGMRKHPDVFSELFLSMIEAGEAGGVMDEILRRLADLLEKQAENEAKVKSALQYPKMVLSAMVFAISILMWKVVPTFIAMFEKEKLQLPLATKMLIAFNHAFTTYWYYLLASVVLAYLAFKRYTATEIGHRQWDHLMLKMPIMGPVMLKSSMAKFARILGTLQMGGVPILDILTVTAKVVDNVVIEKIILDVRTGVQEGLGLAAPLKTSGFVPPLVTQMIAAGETSGALDEMMLKVADYYDEEVDRAVKSLSTMIEPILLVFMGATVLFLALAIFMPMWDLTQMARK